MLAVELRPEERRSPLQNFVSPPKLTDLLLQLPQLPRFGRGHASHVAVVDIGLLDPRPDGLDPVSELRRDPLDRPVLAPQLRSQGSHHPDRCGLLLRRIPTRGRLPRSLIRHHDSILVSKVRSLQQSQGASEPAWSVSGMWGSTSDRSQVASLHTKPDYCYYLKRQLQLVKHQERRCGSRGYC